MKTKFERMSREERKELYKKYKLEKSEFAKKMKNMFILCGVGIGFSVLMFIYDYFFRKSKINYILDIIIFIFCLIASFRIYCVKKELLNNYALKIDNEYKKKIVKKYKK